MKASIFISKIQEITAKKGEVEIFTGDPMVGTLVEPDITEQKITYGNLNNPGPSAANSQLDDDVIFIF